MAKAVSCFAGKRDHEASRLYLPGARATNLPKSLGEVMGKFGENSGDNPAEIYFGDFRLDRRTGELRKGTRELKLTPRVATVLAFLVDRSPQIVTKQELFAEVWKGRPAGDEALTSCIRELRRV